MEELLVLFFKKKTWKSNGKTTKNRFDNISWKRMSQKTKSLPRGLCEKQDELNPVNFWEDHQYIYILNLQWLRKKIIQLTKLMFVT